MQNQTIAESVRRKDLPLHLQNKFNTDFVRVIYKPDEDVNMPPEEDIKPEFIKAVQESERSVAKGEYFECEDIEDVKKLFREWREE